VPAALRSKTPNPTFAPPSASGNDQAYPGTVPAANSMTSASGSPVVGV
jgi:hypothetical protein